ncbi:hypothetical protein AB1Y20_005381 [Prymnesium parvum]|uniref:Uncharacterized protein n=1 Tax=Prymnesium parvum TaxID=97485 RepID=A0AB34J441_PRYPA
MLAMAWAIESASLVERTTRSFVTQTIGEQAVGLKVLQPFVDKLLDANFAKSSLADWQAQFRIFEKQSTFLEAMKRSQEAKATRPSRQVNYLTGHSILSSRRAPL